MVDFEPPGVGFGPLGVAGGLGVGLTVRVDPAAARDVEQGLLRKEGDCKSARVKFGRTVMAYDVRLGKDVVLSSDFKRGKKVSEEFHGKKVAVVKSFTWKT